MRAADKTAKRRCCGQRRKKPDSERNAAQRAHAPAVPKSQPSRTPAAAALLPARRAARAVARRGTAGRPFLMSQTEVLPSPSRPPQQRMLSPAKEEIMPREMTAAVGERGSHGVAAAATKAQRPSSRHTASVAARQPVA